MLELFNHNFKYLLLATAQTISSWYLEVLLINALISRSFCWLLLFFFLLLLSFLARFLWILFLVWDSILYKVSPLLSIHALQLLFFSCYFFILLFFLNQINLTFFIFIIVVCVSVFFNIFLSSLVFAILRNILDITIIRILSILKRLACSLRLLSLKTIIVYSLMILTIISWWLILLWMLTRILRMTMMVHWLWFLAYLLYLLTVNILILYGFY